MEMIARPADLEPVAGAHVVMDPDRSAPAFGFVQYSDLQGVRVGRIAAKGILPCQVRRAALDIDVRAGRPLRHLPAVGRYEPQLDDAFGESRNSVHQHWPADRMSGRLADADWQMLVARGGIDALGVALRIPLYS
jgi:hypothetical protein